MQYWAALERDVRVWSSPAKPTHLLCLNRAQYDSIHMSKKDEQLVLGGLLLLGLGALLSSNPRCSRGCQTVAQHLTSHAIDDIIGGLFGV
jgi:hypothetical protein